MVKGLRIAFGCQARVGKSTGVQYLIQNYGGSELSFARPLYEILYFAQKKCGFDLQKDRKFLQWVGTQWAREKEPDIWVNCLLRELKTSHEENIYVSDIRFPNELEALKKEGFTCVRIIRNNSTTESSTSTHVSETSLTGLPLTEWDEAS